MKLFFTPQSFLVLIIGLLALSMAASFASRRVQFLRLPTWRNKVTTALLLNVVGFATVCVLFDNIYGFITDDVNYIRFAAGYRQPMLWEVRRPTDFMLFVAYPFRILLGFDRPSLHVMFACMGFAGSALYFSAYSRGLELRDRTLRATATLAFWCLFCFPNLVAWGRFFGKDSLIFTAAGLYTLAARRLLTATKLDVTAIVMAFGSTYVIQMIRPHIAAALVAGLASGLLMVQFSRTETGQRRRGAMMRTVLPVAVAGIALMFGVYAVTRLTGKVSPTVEDAQESIVSAARMGSYGGSATDLGSELDENPSIVFSPARVALNIFNLYFAPMPWQIRGAYQIIAFLSNVLLLVLIMRRWRYLRVRTPWAWFLVFTAGYLTVILSFMTGNVGLAMRQKIIILPLLFMFVLDPSAATKRRRRPRAAPLQASQPPPENTLLSV